jgi:hypothetical protein
MFQQIHILNISAIVSGSFVFSYLAEFGVAVCFCTHLLDEDFLEVETWRKGQK